MEEVRNTLRSLTQKVCHELEGVVIPTRPVRTVDDSPDTPPHVAIDPARPALSELSYRLTLGLLGLPEYNAVADAVENDNELKEGVIVSGGLLQKPERTNITRAFVTNFLWRYLREGNQLEWVEKRFAETFNELREEVSRKSIVSHTILPLSNLKMDIDGLEFGEEFRLEPASVDDLERWMNPDRSLPLLGTGPPQWDTQYVDRPAVLHARQTVVGHPTATDLHSVLQQLPRVNADHAITALRLVLNAPISVIFQEHDDEGLLAFGGHSTSWSWLPPPPHQVVTLDQEKATEVIRVWQVLQSSPNSGFLTLPLRRWESCLMRPSLEDRLIDAWVSLEALLLGGREGELSYRAAVRLAEFLGTSGVERKGIYEETRISYTWRSVIVHALSSKKVAKRQPLEEAVRITTDRLRSVLLKVLDLPSRFDPDKLETDLLRRE